MSWPVPPGEATRVVVWRVGDALLAVPLDAAIEIAAVAPDGRAATRAGSLELWTPPGLQEVDDCRRAVVVRAGEGSVAMAAETVEGVKPYTEREAAPTPPWLRSLATPYMAGLIRLDDDRVAALLAVESLTAETLNGGSPSGDSPSVE